MTPTLHEGDRLLVRYGARPTSRCRSRSCASPTGWWRSSDSTTSSSDGWWVVRDNAFEGRDSWSGGAIAEDGVLALVLLRLWPRPGRLPAAPVARLRCLTFT